ncbi:zinc ribbon domain-containing protein [Candidatus Mycobacterium methanotrophicum]|uniref:zinc ribbon domain-containing protein n=1 Tax=Candidatus Mycobacterium methanotrophicum TaxID=2943498 RepID=UPI00358DC579
MGAYVHGRYTSTRRVDPDGAVHTGLVERPRAQWPVCIHDHHEGYLGWADYLANETALAANRTNAGARPPREGPALCQGIIACGSRGKPIRTNYHTDHRPSYECSGRADRLTTPTCRSIAAATVDEAVTEKLLNALNPNEIALALAAADPPTRSPTGTGGSAGPLNSPSNAPATTPIEPTAPSTQSSRTTGSRPAT